MQRPSRCAKVRAEHIKLKDAQAESNTLDLYVAQ